MERPNLTTKNLFILILHLIGLAKTKDLVFCESLFLTQTTPKKAQDQLQIDRYFHGMLHEHVLSSY
jgi:hypothetical protein